MGSLLEINSWNCWSTVFGALVGAGGLYGDATALSEAGGISSPFLWGLPDPHFTPSRPTPRCSAGPCPGPPSACWPRLLPWLGARARWLPGTAWRTDRLTERQRAPDGGSWRALHGTRGECPPPAPLSFSELDRSLKKWHWGGERPPNSGPDAQQGRATPLTKPVPRRAQQG